MSRGKEQGDFQRRLKKAHGIPELIGLGQQASVCSEHSPQELLSKLHTIYGGEKQTLKPDVFDRRTALPSEIARVIKRRKE